MSNELVIISSVGSAKKPNDARGAFIPWGRFYAQQKDFNVTKVAEINLTTLPQTRTRNVESAITSADGIDTVVFFGHGYTSGLQTGHAGVLGMKAFGKALENRGVKRLITFACSFGGGKFAPMLFDYCSTLVQVSAHTTEGHTVCNPNVVYLGRDNYLRFAIDGARKYGDPTAYRGRMGANAIKKGVHRFPLDVMRLDPTNEQEWKAFWEKVK